MAQPNPFALLEWGSNPKDNNDDCHCGEDFPTEAEARAALGKLRKSGRAAFYELDGPGVYELVADPTYSTETYDAADRSEALWLGRMTHGDTFDRDYPELTGGR